MANKNKFAGCPYPLIKHPRGYFYSQSGVKQVQSDLLILLLTNPGERVMMPDFGTPLKKLFFDPSDDQLAAKAQKMISDSIQKWEPRITVSAIDIVLAPTTSDFGQQQDSSHILGIRINFFDPGSIQQVQELVLEVPLGGASS